MTDTQLFISLLLLLAVLSAYVYGRRGWPRASAPDAGPVTAEVIDTDVEWWSIPDAEDPDRPNKSRVLAHVRVTNPGSAPVVCDVELMVYRMPEGFERGPSCKVDTIGFPSADMPHTTNERAAEMWGSLPIIGEASVPNSRFQWFGISRGVTIEPGTMQGWLGVYVPGPPEGVGAVGVTVRVR